MNFESASKALEDMAKNLDEKSKADKAGLMASEMIRNHIYTGEGMPPLSAATTAYRGQGKPLQDTGALRDSITYELIGNNTASVGTNKVYAPIQNNGGTITAKKNWLFIPAAGVKKLEGSFGYGPTNVLKGLKAKNYVYRVGRTICYRERGTNAPGRVVYYLKKSVVIPKRRFFYLSDEEISQMLSEVSNDIL